MRDVSYNQRVKAANERQKLHTSEMVDLIEHMLEVRDVAAATGIPFDVVADLAPGIYEALKVRFDREVKAARIAIDLSRQPRRKSER